MAKLAEDLTKNDENQAKSGWVWKNVTPPARAAENMAKVSQEAPNIIQKSSKIEP